MAFVWFALQDSKMNQLLCVQWYVGVYIDGNVKLGRESLPQTKSIEFLHVRS